jgi:hypothetical protein
MKITGNINSRSPQVREILETPAGWITRWGMWIVTFVIIALLAAGWRMTYPTKLHVAVILTGFNPTDSVDTVSFSTRLDCAHAGTIGINNKITLYLTLRPRIKPRKISGRILSVPVTTTTAEGCRVEMRVWFFHSDLSGIQGMQGPVPGMTGEMTIVTREKRLLELLIPPLGSR